jgi:hypothetical protein
MPGEWPGMAELSDQTLTSATRLVLTHVALELGEFWVAVDPGNHVRAAVVLLPPGRKGGQMMDVAVRLELGLLPKTLPKLAILADVPEQHWLLLPAAAPDDDQVLRELIDAAMPAVDADGRSVLCLQSGPAPELLFELGFRALPAPVRHGSASLRLGLDSSIDVRTSPSGSTAAPV